MDPRRFSNPFASPALVSNPGLGLELGPQLRPPRPRAQRKPRIKHWAQNIADRSDAYGRALGVPLGEILGCGHWGCVFDSTPPWVVKFSLDPNEGPIWQRILELLDEEAYGQGGLTRVKLLTRVEPGIKSGQRTKKLYAVVREAVAPAFMLGRGGEPFLTPHTAARLGLSPNPDWRYDRSNEIIWDARMSRETGAEFARTYQADEFVENIKALQRYRIEAFEWQRLRGPARDVTSHDRLERAINHMRGPTGGPLGETLQMLLSNEVVLGDVHLFNVGWRLHRDAPGFSGEDHTLVIFDPGHTPTRKNVPISTTLVSNPWRC